MTAAQPVSTIMGPSLHLLALVSLSTFIPAALARECLTVPGLPNGHVNATCVFPFIHKGRTYDSCKRLIRQSPGDGWCSTGVDSDGVHVKGNWGLCGPDCPLECGQLECVDGRACPHYRKYKQKLCSTSTRPSSSTNTASIDTPTEGTSCQLEADPSGTFLPGQGQCGLACDTPSRVIGEILFQF